MKFYGAEYRTSLERHISAFDSIRADRSRAKPAAVAICVVVKDGALAVLMTRRNARLREHAGQFALPGGRRDGLESAEQTALRELAEETGLVLAPTDVVGMLDDYVTRSGYRMTPVVCWGGVTDGSLVGAPSEVEEVYVVPLVDLDVEPEYLTIPESDQPVIRLPFLGRFLHAPAAAIIYQFCRVALHGENVRVAHLEQPLFAWR